MDGTEIGAYTMLIVAHYQAGECGLPLEDKKLMQITHTTPKVWRRIKETVLEKFSIEGDRITHDRIVEDLQKMKEKAGPGRGKKSINGIHSETLQSPVTDSQQKNKSLNLNDTQKTTPNPITHTHKKKKIQKKESEFEEFWNLCPRRVGKGAAREKYWKAREKIQREDLNRAIKRHAREVKGKEKEFIPHPSTWLHQERYHDETTIPESEPITEWAPWKKALAAQIGEHNVKGWFAGVVKLGDTFKVPRRFQVDKIKNEFGIELEKIFGKHEVELMQ
jgi:uncharacterized protein YdaU (DUF1376 family)